MKYNQENIEKLAKVVVDSWDMKTLVHFAIDKLANAYDIDEEAYNYDYNIHKDELKFLKSIPYTERIPFLLNIGQKKWSISIICIIPTFLILLP